MPMRYNNKFARSNNLIPKIPMLIVDLSANLPVHTKILSLCRTPTRAHMCFPVPCEAGVAVLRHNSLHRPPMRNSSKTRSQRRRKSMRSIPITDRLVHLYAQGGAPLRTLTTHSRRSHAWEGRDTLERTTNKVIHAAMLINSKPKSMRSNKYKLINAAEEGEEEEEGAVSIRINWATGWEINDLWR